MLIRQASDLHIEHAGQNYSEPHFIDAVLPPMEEDSETVLILGGDIGPGRSPHKIAKFLELLVPRFKYIIYLLGNHEHYGESIGETRNYIEDECKHIFGLNKIAIVGNTLVEIQIDDVTFLVGTMWTGMNNDPVVQQIVQSYLNDYNLIYRYPNSTQKIIPQDTCDIHNVFITRLQEALKNTEGKVVVCTHHMPSFSAIDPKYKTNELSLKINHGFTSDLDAIIEKYEPLVWTFGHTHTSYDDYLFKTRLICNPLGYPGENNLTLGIYNPTCRFEV